MSATQNKSRQPQIRVQGFNSNWQKTKLKNIAKFSKGSGFSKSDLRPDGHPIVLYGRLYTHYETIINAVNTFVNCDSGSIKSIGGEVLIPASGETSEDIVRASVLECVDVIIGGDLNIVRPSADLNSTFLALLITHGSPSRELAKKAQGKSVVHLRKADLEATDVFFPSIAEQTAIGQYFAELDSLIAHHRQQQAQIRQLKQAMLGKMFPAKGEKKPKIRLQGFSGDWQEVRLGEVVEIVGGGTPDTTNASYWDGGINWFSPTEIGENVYACSSSKKISAMGLEKSSAKILPPGKTVLFTSRASIGDMAILQAPAATNQGFQSFIAKKIDVYFLYVMGAEIKAYAIKNASGSTFLEISKAQLASMEILTPSPEEQTAIGQFFKQLDDTLALHSRQLTLLQNLKNACLQKMFV